MYVCLLAPIQNSNVHNLGFISVGKSFRKNESIYALQWNIRETEQLEKYDCRSTDRVRATKVLREDHIAAAAAATNKTKSENICSTAENIAFFEFFFCCQQTFNKFISQQKHHSAELSTTRLSISPYSSFLLVSFFLFYL